MYSMMAGKTLAYALFNLQNRGKLFLGHGKEVYIGQIVGLHSRDNDLPVNPTKAKQLTNIRAAGTDENLILVPHIKHTLEQALEFIEDDELVEVTPESFVISQARRMDLELAQLQALTVLNKEPIPLRRQKSYNQIFYKGSILHFLMSEQSGDDVLGLLHDMQEFSCCTLVFALCHKGLHRMLQACSRCAIQRTTASGVCSVLDMYINGRIKSKGFVKQELISWDDFIDNKFGKVYI